MADAPLILLAEPPPEVAGPYTELAGEGRRRLGDELADRFRRAGARVERLAPADPRRGAAFHWGRWFAGAARRALATSRAGSLGYATAGSLALVDDDFIAALLAPRNAGTAVANNRFSADAFVVSGDLARAVSVLESAPSDNSAARCLADAGFAVADLADRRFSSADVDTPHDLALVALARPLPLPRELAIPSVPRADQLGVVVRDRSAEVVVAGRVATSTVAYLQTETACRVRLFVEERGMRSAPTAPRSLLARWLERHGARGLVEELAALGDAVVLDTRVLMAAVSRSSDPAGWPPAEERFASDLHDAAAITTPWLRELTEAAAASPIPVLLGGHLLVNDGLRILVQRAWEAAEA